MKKHILSLCLLTLVAYGRMFSSDGTDGNQKPVKSAVRQYAKEHIMPVLIQKRQELEKELTIAEKNEIAESRATLKQLREQQREFMKQKPEGMSMRDYMEENGQAARSDMHKQMKAVMEKLEAIAERHSNTLDKFKTDLAPSVKQWKEDIARLQLQSKQNDGSSQQHSYHGYHGMEGNMFHGLNGEHAQAHFLLLSATVSENNEDILNNSDNELKSDMIGAAPASTSAPITSFQVTPNPASNEIVTGNNPMPDGNELLIYDMQGKAVATLQNVQPSQHIDISSLANGTYIVQLKSGDQKENRKVVVTH